ncbi:MAG: IS1380 family transposase, partial [Solirubrobacteraceae bacterium]
DFDATPIDVHSEKEQAAGHYKGGFGFNPLLVTCGREMLAGVLRPGNAGANNAADHLELLDLALEQLPQSALDGEILARSDSAGASRDLADSCRECDIRFSFGYHISEPVRAGLVALEESAWRPAIDQDGKERDGAWVTELTGKVNLPGRPHGTRLICRRERPHPGAQLSFTDVDGHRFQCFITDHSDTDIAALEALHRQHAQVEDRVKTLKATGAEFLPFHSFVANVAWLELALCGHDIMIWTQLLTLDGEHQSCEPKRLRYRILHVAGQLTRHARRIILHLPADWPWTGAILRAFKRVQAPPAHGS